MDENNDQITIGTPTAQRWISEMQYDYFLLHMYQRATSSLRVY